jgi:GNAT superfamily N-acetyltransferase
MDAATLAALDANYLDASRLFVVGAPGGEYQERHDAAVVCCGLPVRSLNWAFLKPPYADLAATAAAARAYFAARKLPYQLSYRDPEGAPAKALAGTAPGPEPTPGLVLPLPAEIPPVPEGLKVEPVATPAQLARFREAAFTGFGYPPQIAHRFMHDALLAQPHVRLFSGLMEGEVVATSLLVATGRVAGIYWVATLEPARRRGFGAALTWAAVAAGQQARCEIASLQASTLGRPVYEKMGFAHVLEYEHLVPEAE